MTLELSREELEVLNKLIAMPITMQNAPFDLAYDFIVTLKSLRDKVDEKAKESES